MSANVTETKFLEVSPQLLLVDGGTDGKVAILGACNFFKVGQRIFLKSSSQIPLKVKICRFESDTEFIVGPFDKPVTAGLGSRLDISAYAIADSATVGSLEQPRPSFSSDHVLRYVYSEEPAMALRNLSVDQCGNPWTTDNPFPVQLSDGDVNIGTVEANIEVHTTHLDDSPVPGRIHDSMRIGDGTTLAKIDVKNRSFSTNRYEKLLPLLANARWLNLANYEEVTTVFAGDVATLSYLQAGNTIARAIFTFVDDIDWSYKLESYINGDDGSILLDDDSTSLFLD